MSADDLLARAELFTSSTHPPHYRVPVALVADLAAEVNRLRAERDALRSVVRRLLDGWVIDGQDPDTYPELWVKPSTAHEHITDSERAVLTTSEGTGQ